MHLSQKATYDVIKIVGLTATGRHGVYPSERRNGQPFSVDVIMYVDTRQAASDDDLALTVDYSDVAADVNAILAGPPVYLIETLAHRVAEAVLRYDPVQIVEVEVHKPNAPMHYEFNDVSMTIRRTREEVYGARRKNSSAAEGSAEMSTAEGSAEMSTAEASIRVSTVGTPTRDASKGREGVRAVIALGGNMGKAWQTLAQAVLDLDNTVNVDIVGVSGLFKTAPLLAPGQAAQDDYYNAVVEVRTSLKPLSLLDAMQAIEQKHGRTRTGHWQPRTLDLDMIVYGDASSDDPRLTLPHPHAHERAFVLQPWLQIDPDAQLGAYGSVAALLASLPDQSIENVNDTWVESALEGKYPGEDAPPTRTSPDPQAQTVPGLTQPKDAQSSSEVQVPTETEPVVEPPRLTRAQVRSRTRAQAHKARPAQRSRDAKLVQQTLPKRAARHADTRSQTATTLPTTSGAESTASPLTDPGEASAARPITEPGPASAPNLSTVSSVESRPSPLTQPEVHDARRIIDDADELFRIEEEPPALSSAQPRPRPRKRPRMDTGLGEDFPSGLIPLTNTPKRVSRRTIMRPTVTGAIPIVNGEGGAHASHLSGGKRAVADWEKQMRSQTPRRAQRRLDSDSKDEQES